jgi:hypothetical protein
LITSPQIGAGDLTADIIVIVGDYAPTPIKGLFRVYREFTTPVVYIAGLQEMDADNLPRKLAEGRRESRKRGPGRFLERDTAIVEGVRFVGMHTPDAAFILEVLSEPHDGPTVVITYHEPRDGIDEITRTGKVARWIHAGTTTTEPLVIEV